MTATPTASAATALTAAFIVDTPVDAIPAHVLHEAKRTLINLYAVALSASQDPSVAALEAAADPGTPEATVIGRGRAAANHVGALGWRIVGKWVSS